MQEAEQKWYQIDYEAVLEKLDTKKEGLSQDEAETRLRQHGSNILPREKRFKVWLFLLDQLKSPLVYILLIAGFISTAIGHNFDAIVIFAAVAVNIGIGFYQEFSSNRTLEKLIEIVKILARVKRGDEIHEINSEKLVPGDIILIKAGMKIPADARLILVKNLKTNEALLTGESAPIEKHVETIDKDVTIGDRINMVFMGSIVEKGEGTAVVVKTGNQTEIGKIAQLTKRAKKETTPLQERIEHLGKVIAIIVAIASILIVAIGYLEDIPLGEIFITSIAVAVAAIPEGLPATIAVILAVSSRRILDKKGLVRRLIAAESLGSTSVICVDKTGTLTEGKMKVEKIITDGNTSLMLDVFALANEAIIEKFGNEYEIKGESTDQAKMHAFFDNNRSLDRLLKLKPRLNLLSFDSNNQFMASFHKLEGKKIGIYVTGATETLLKLSSSVIDEGKKKKLTEEKALGIDRHNDELAEEGYRVIGAAYGEVNEEIEIIENADEKKLLEFIKNLSFLGLAAIRDPIRQEVEKIMGEVIEAGLRVVMLTGDHKLTALSVGKKIGLATDSKAILGGEELNKMSDADLKEVIRDISIFARVNPEHKLRIAKAWKSVGESVAMTGDGINDAPALKVADIGIAVGSGTDVTKETADLVLLDNSFVTIIEAIKQGRTAFDNIRKVTVFLLSNAFTEVILILGALLLRIPLPLIAVQILWTNLAEDGLPNFALAFEPPEDDVLKRKPIERGERILDSRAKFIAYPMGIITDIILLSIFILFLNFSNYDIGYIRTFIFAALGTDSLFFIFALKSLDKSIFKINPFNNKYLLFAIGFGFLMIIAAVYLPLLNTVLQTVPLKPIHVLFIIGLGIAKLFIIEGIKAFYRKYARK